jgi:hypothetical protein
MTKRGDNNGWYKKGQEDAKKGEYSNPHDNPRDNMFATYDDTEIKDQKAYKEGREHWRKQTGK